MLDIKNIVAMFLLGAVAISNVLGQEVDSKFGRSDIEEIVVTAQKREQSLQDVGISVTVFSSDDIRALGMREISDIASQTPSLDIKNGRGSTNPIITLRGLGITDTYTNNNPSVGIYIDQVNLPTSAYLSFQMFDVERVEVLKGPQGTLYGRNTTAGAINFITGKPTEKFEAHVNVDYSSWNTLNLEGAVSGPLSANLKGRLAIMTAQSDGYLKNIGTIGLNAGQVVVEGIPGVETVGPDDSFLEQNTRAVRGSLSWIPSEEVDVYFTAHYTRDRSDNYVYKLVDGGRAGGLGRNGFFPADNDPHKVESNLEPKIDHESWGGALGINWDIGFATLTSLTGYEKLERFMTEEDGSPFRNQENHFTDEQWTVSEEIRLSTNSTDDLFWTVGAFYAREYIDYLRDVVLLDVLRGTATGTIDGQSESWSIFGQTEWQFSDQFKLTAGARYNADDRSMDATTTDTDLYGTSILTARFGLPIVVSE